MDRPAGIDYIIAIIPARAGSKGLIGKNSKMIKGKRLAAWTIESALESEHIDQVIVSTDCAKVIECAEGYRRSHDNLHIIYRPESLATDEAPVWDVNSHALAWFLQRPDAEEANVVRYNSGVVVGLHPTYPNRPKGMIDSVIDRFFAYDCDSLVVATPTHQNVWRKDSVKGVEQFNRLAPDIKRVRRQDCEPLYIEHYGLCNVHDASVVGRGLRLGNRVWIYENTDPRVAIDIDDQASFDLMCKILPYSSPDYDLYLPHPPDGL